MFQKRKRKKRRKKKPKKIRGKGKKYKDERVSQKYRRGPQDEVSTLVSWILVEDSALSTFSAAPLTRTLDDLPPLDMVK